MEWFQENESNSSLYLRLSSLLSRDQSTSARMIIWPGWPRSRGYRLSWQPFERIQLRWMRSFWAMNVSTFRCPTIWQMVTTYYLKSTFTHPNAKACFNLRSRQDLSRKQHLLCLAFCQCHFTRKPQCHHLLDGPRENNMPFCGLLPYHLHPPRCVHNSICMLVTDKNIQRKV